MHITTSVPPRKLMILDGVGAAAHLVQVRSFVLPKLHIDHATITLVMIGKKVVYGECGESNDCVGTPGDLILLPPGASYSMLNDADRDGRPYEAMVLVVDPALIQQVANASPSSVPMSQPRSIKQVEAGFRESILRAIQLIQEQTTPAAIVRHAVMEVLTWIGLSGLHFAPVQAPSFTDTLRAQLARSPDDAWTSAKAASLLNVSEATLRRRLAHEDWTMGALLQEVRLSYAMMMLQSCDAYVGQIALDAGFANHAHFSRLFKKRFGITPTQLRNPLPLVS